MKFIFTLPFLLLLFTCVGQRTPRSQPFSFTKDCDISFVEEQFVNQRNTFFYMEGVEDSKPFVELKLRIITIKEISDTAISIELSAGREAETQTAPVITQA